MESIEIKYSSKDLITASNQAWQGGYDRAIADVLMYLDINLNDNPKYAVIRKEICKLTQKKRYQLEKGLQKWMKKIKN